LVNRAVIELLLDKLADEEKLLVCGTAMDPECRGVLRELRPGSFVKRVPASILDDYRLRRRERLVMAAALDWSEASKAIDNDAKPAEQTTSGVAEPVRAAPE
jgi:hypothetical protein